MTTGRIADHFFVLFDDPALKDTKALFDVIAEFHIHAGFVILDGIASAENRFMASSSEMRK
jgi:hypothetical protein